MRKEQQAAHCALCGAPLSEQELAQCRKLKERFNGHRLCLTHQRRFSGCPGLRYQPLR